jgi:hypothetical protein
VLLHPAVGDEQGIVGLPGRGAPVSCKMWLRRSERK